MLHKSIVKRLASQTGYGLFTTRKIKKGEIVWELDDSCRVFPLKKEIKRKYPRANQVSDKYVI